MLSPTQTISATPATVQLGEILEVDADRWTVTVRAEMTREVYRFVPIPSSYGHRAEGEGIHYMPEPGSRCLLVISRDIVVPLVFIPPSSGGGYAGNRPALNPGDIALLTRDQNGIRIGRGGLVEIQATPSSYIALNPTTDSIFSFAENHQCCSPGGTVTWSSDRPEEIPSGRTPTRLHAQFREFAEDPEPCVDIEIGHLPEETRVDGGQRVLHIGTRTAIGFPTSNLSANQLGQWEVRANKVTVTKTLLPLIPQPVLLSTAFLTDLNTALIALSAAVPASAAALSPLITTITAQLGGFGNYASTTLESA
jgi:hypothetical protein